MKRLVVLVSGSGSNLQALIEACAGGTIAGRIVLVVSSKPGAYGLTRAGRAHIQTLVAPPPARAQGADVRRAYDADLARDVSAVQPDLIVLAGWMHVLSPAFLDHVPCRVINLHPALPGELPGTHAIERAYEAFRNGARSRTGIMVHEVVPEVDAGPVLGAVEVPIEPGDTLDTLETRMHVAEHRLLVEVVGACCRD